MRWGRMKERSFWILASFWLSHRPQRACSLAKAPPKHQKSPLRMATVFLQTLQTKFLIQPLRGPCGRPPLADGHHLRRGSVTLHSNIKKAIMFGTRVERVPTVRFTDCSGAAGVLPDNCGRAKIHVEGGQNH